MMNSKKILFYGIAYAIAGIGLCFIGYTIFGEIDFSVLLYIFVPVLLLYFPTAIVVMGGAGGVYGNQIYIYIGTIIIVFIINTAVLVFVVRLIKRKVKSIRDKRNYLGDRACLLTNSSKKV